MWASRFGSSRNRIGLTHPSHPLSVGCSYPDSADDPLKGYAVVSRVCPDPTEHYSTELDYPTDLDYQTDLDYSTDSDSPTDPDHSTKFSTSVAPESVRILSGWNCTPT
jgi:hypothetical protein